MRYQPSLISSLIRIVLCCCASSLISSCRTHLHPDKKIFRYNQPEGIASLDPAFAKNQSVMWAIHQLYSCLVEVDEEMKISPALAHSWQFSADGRIVTFHLRTDVYFHDDACFAAGKGRRVDAADVEYSFSRLMDPSTASPGAWIFNNRVDTANPFRALNDSTFELRLSSAFQPILGMLSM